MVTSGWTLSWIAAQRMQERLLEAEAERRARLAAAVRLPPVAPRGRRGLGLFRRLLRRETAASSGLWRLPAKTLAETETRVVCSAEG